MAEEGLKLSIGDVHVTAQALETAIKRKVFTEEEASKIITSWMNVIRFCEEVKRKSEIDSLYKKEDAKEESKIEEIK